MINIFTADFDFAFLDNKSAKPSTFFCIRVRFLNYYTNKVKRNYR